MRSVRPKMRVPFSAATAARLLEGSTYLPQARALHGQMIINDLSDPRWSNDHMIIYNDTEKKDERPCAGGVHARDETEPLGLPLPLRVEDHARVPHRAVLRKQLPESAHKAAPCEGCRAGAAREICAGEGKRDEEGGACEAPCCKATCCKATCCKATCCKATCCKATCCKATCCKASCSFLGGGGFAHGSEERHLMGRPPTKSSTHRATAWPRAAPVSRPRPFRPFPLRPRTRPSLCPAACLHYTCVSTLRVLLLIYTSPPLNAYIPSS
jgi:hypothetical protein